MAEMVEPQVVYERWTRCYMGVLLMGYKALPAEIQKYPVEEQASILRGMMVDAGKSGLIPTAKEVVEMLEKKVPEAPKETPVAPGQRDLTGHETKGKSAVEMATQAQVDGIRRWTTPGARRIIDDYLMNRKASSPADLTKAEAMELMDELGSLAKKRQGAPA